jgi:hypothetical protein
MPILPEPQQALFRDAIFGKKVIAVAKGMGMKESVTMLSQVNCFTFVHLRLFWSWFPRHLL